MVRAGEQLKQALKDNKLSFTSSRQVIFATLQDKEPQSMQEIVASCSGKVDRASVYRTIALFERTGIVQRLQIGWKYKLELSDNFHHHHHHLTCTKCGRIIPLTEDTALEKRLASLASGKNFSMAGHQLEIQGLCSNCR